MKGSITHWLAQRLFKLLGWKIIGDLPPGLPKAVLVMAPHTSNWDFFYGMLTVFSKRAPIKFAIKKEAMFFPLGYILKKLGAIPINRQPKNVGLRTQVEQISNIVKNSKNLFLIIAPEGTRKYVLRWKTGFYHIAIQANIPIILGYLDYAKKHAGIGPVFYPTGHMEQDIQAIQDFYADKSAKYPSQGVRTSAPS
jgi:1-acyl-sn-glycerol-3-phosphate acyltransferase